MYELGAYIISFRKRKKLHTNKGMKEVEKGRKRIVHEKTGSIRKIKEVFQYMRDVSGNYVQIIYCAYYRFEKKERKYIPKKKGEKWRKERRGLKMKRQAVREKVRNRWVKENKMKGNRNINDTNIRKRKNR